MIVQYIHGYAFLAGQSIVAFLNNSYNKVCFGFNKHVSYSAYNTKSLGASISFQLPLYVPNMKYCAIDDIEEWDSPWQRLDLWLKFLFLHFHSLKKEIEHVGTMKQLKKIINPVREQKPS